MCAEYVWIGGMGGEIRSKTMILHYQPKTIKDLPEWNFDGSSTGQAKGKDSDILLRFVG